MAALTNYYRILGVSPDANPMEIKKAYHQLAKIYHPDVSEDPYAKLKFQKINEAYHILINPKTRRLHDFKVDRDRRRRYGASVAGENINRAERAGYAARYREAHAYHSAKATWKYKAGKVDKMLFASLLVIGGLAIVLGVLDVINREEGEDFNFKGIIMGVFFSLILIYGWRTLTRK